MKEQLSSRSIKLSNEILLGSVVEFVKSGKQVKINITGSSMQPFLYNGDTILLSGLAYNMINLGDIILGKYNGHYVLHRVVRRYDEYLIIAGDNNLKQVEKIEKENVFAVAVELIEATKIINLRNRISRIKGLMWFYLRPLRSLYVFLFK